MEPPIQLKSVVLFIACGATLFVIVFIFAKRQITRFTLKSSRAPHAPMGASAPKALRQEIERQLGRTREICYQPPLLSDTLQDKASPPGSTHYLHRMKAMDALPQLDVAVKNFSVNITRRTASHQIRSYLLELRQTGPLVGVKLDLIEKFADSYDRARHDPNAFGKEHFEEFSDLLSQLIEHIDKQREEKLGVSSADKPNDDSRHDPHDVTTPGASLDQPGMTSSSVSGETSVCYRGRAGTGGHRGSDIELREHLLETGDGRVLSVGATVGESQI